MLNAALENMAMANPMPLKPVPPIAARATPVTVGTSATTTDIDGASRMMAQASTTVNSGSVARSVSLRDTVTYTIVEDKHRNPCPQPTSVKHSWDSTQHGARGRTRVYAADIFHTVPETDACNALPP